MKRSEQRETVVLLHGLGLAAWAMQAIAYGLRRADYRVINLSYPSRGLRLETLAAEWLPRRLREHRVEHAKRLHFVTHSLGGILLRQWRIANELPLNFGCAVMIAPPNHGSAVVDRLRGRIGFNRFLGINGLRLGEGADSVPNMQGPWPASAGSVGVIAGDQTLDPIFSSWLEKPNDGKVTVASARLAGMKDFCVLPYSHTFILWRRATLREVLAFLRTGAFTPK